MREPSIISGPAEPPLLEISIGAALRRTAETHPDNLAIASLFENRRLTYRELDAEVDCVARALLAHGAAKGDRLAIWSPNRIDWPILHHAAARIGLIVVTVNPAFRAEEMAYALNDSGARFLFAAPAFRNYSYVDAVAAVRPRLTALEHVVFFGTQDRETGWAQFLSKAAEVSTAALIDTEKKVTAEDACNIQYTSGTTGKPKGALLTHRNLLNNGHFVGERQRFSPDDTICLPVPFFHCFGIGLGALAALTHGSAIVLPGESFDPVACLKAIVSERCTAFYGVPMMYMALLDHPHFAKGDFSSLRTGCMGGAPCPIETMRRAVARMNMGQITVVYGMTETSPISFQSLPDDSNDIRVSTVGCIHPHLDAKVVDPASGETLPRGQRGELCVRGYSVMRGYWKKPEETAQAIDAEGWMHSGDMAVMTDDGYVQIVGRIKDTIIRGGENVYPREIEEFLLTVQGIGEAYVFGLPDDKYGEIVACWLKPASGADIDADSVRAACKGEIATYKIPALVRIVKEFPATASGKVQRFRMREMELAGEVSEASPR
ncbi:AMP-binding protein [Tepidamorphus sp. 3E244]|uniref:AMP-binding protein n=1 Tax=Tepidamorphus sp. 3E244 TaxID=3385498 RepID=UPI0038FD0542